MNLKHFYYRGYFDRHIKLSQPEKKEDRKKNEEVNETAFRLKNAILTSTDRVTLFSPISVQKIKGVQELHLQVQNPGLLPGIGYPHEVGYQGEFKLGFGFDHVTGLPLLPGSSVKGVLRSVFPQYAFNAEEHPEWPKNGDALQLEKANYIVKLLHRFGLAVPADPDESGIKNLAHALELSIFCGWDFTNPENPKHAPMHQHDVFFDALPTAFGHNYLGETQLLGRDALTPHGADPLKNPTPLPFVKVMPGVTFGFYFRLCNTTIGTLTITAEQKRRLFGEILCTVGAGAKTNVGYGQFLSLTSEDRVPDPTRNAAAAAGQNAPAQNENFAAPPPPTTTGRYANLYYNKSLVGKKVIGEVVSAADENPVRFRILNVDGFEGERAVKVPDSLISRFVVSKRFELTVHRSNPGHKEFEVKVENFNPLP